MKKCSKRCVGKMENLKKQLIISKDAPEAAKEKLFKLGYFLIESVRLSNVSPAVSCHPDMQIVKVGNRWICSPDCYEYYKKYISSDKLIKGKTELKQLYPCDIAYNVAATEDVAIHNFKYTDKEIMANCNLENINVSQGYSKCNICIVSNRAFITSDEGIYRELIKHNCDVLLISPGNILLPGYDYGFIGGASGLLDDKTLAFCGNVYLHNDGKRIYEFCRRYGVEIVCLTDRELIDIGTIIPIG